MNTPKKQMRIPSWLPTTCAVLAIVAIILLIYIVVTSIDAPTTEEPSVTPPPSTPSVIPTPDPVLIVLNTPIVKEDSQSSTYTKVHAYLLEKTGYDISADDLAVYKKKTPDENTDLIYAKYINSGVYTVSELFVSDSVRNVLMDDSQLGVFANSSRATNDVAELYIEALINNFYTFRNNLDQPALTDLLSSRSEEDAEAIINRMEYLESISLTDFSINSIASDSVKYVVFASEEAKLFGINTPAPGLSEILFSLDELNLPRIFIGDTDEKTDEARAALKASPSFKTLLETVNSALEEALEKDPALKLAYQNMK